MTLVTPYVLLSQVHIAVQLPARGEYGLEIYANEPDKEGDTFTHMCQYLCSFIEQDVDSHYGQVKLLTMLAASGRKRNYILICSRAREMEPPFLQNAKKKKKVFSPPPLFVNR